MMEDDFKCLRFGPIMIMHDEGENGATVYHLYILVIDFEILVSQFMFVCCHCVTVLLLQVAAP